MVDEAANHLGFLNQSLHGRDFQLGEALSGTDIQMSFVTEFAGVLGLPGPSA